MVKTVNIHQIKKLDDSDKIRACYAVVENGEGEEKIIHSTQIGGETDEEMEAGVRCVAALVFDHRQQVVAAISISGAAMRITPERIEDLAKKVKQCALDISHNMGF